MKKILVSVIVPIYNSDKYLVQCLESITKQSYEHLQIILVDDGSIDESLRICQVYALSDKRINLISQNNMGVSAARNTGIINSNGEYMTFVDSDDWLELNAIETMLDLAIKNECACIRTSYMTNGTKRKIRINNGKYVANQIQKLQKYFIQGREECYVWLLLIRTDIVKASNLFNKNISFLEDRCFYIKLLSLVDSIYISNIHTYNYRINPVSITRSSDSIYSNIIDALNSYKIIEGLISTDDTSLIEATAILHAHIITGYLYASYKAKGKENLASLIDMLSNNNDFIHISRKILSSRADKNVKYIYTKAVIGLMRAKNYSVVATIFRIRALGIFASGGS